ncbi:hypothetical protein FHS91_003694 [Sphingobium xanthum]|jgi:hypothetical protein|uniref:hypothetical protein n=1 Tax=Sphingobium xanthum TaxID=1387165 RepID=UPI001C8CF238|nr:hypothetical protein [Sphingobium xanthum]
MLVGKISASNRPASATIQELQRTRLAGFAEINRLEKLRVKAEQRLLARYHDLIRARAHLRRSRSASASQSDAKEAVDAAERTWDQAADERLNIVVRLLSICRLLSKTQAENGGLAHHRTRRPPTQRD